MSQTYTVQQVVGQGAPYGPQNDVIPYMVLFQEQPGQAIKWGRKSGAPNPGDTVTGTIDWTSEAAVKFGPKMVPDKPAGGYASSDGGRDPRTQHIIQRQSERNSAIALLAQSKTLKDFDFLAASDEDIKLILALVYRLEDAFAKDSDRAADLPAAKAAYGQFPPIERTGESDVPAPPAQQFQHPAPAAAPDEDPIPFRAEPDRSYDGVKTHASRSF